MLTLFRRSLLTFSLAVCASGCVFAPESRAASDIANVHIDWTQPTEPINRAVFGLEGFPKVFAVSRENPRLMDAFLRLNPSGQVARMETWVGFFEPANDNNDPNTFDWSRLHPEKMTRFIEPEQIDAFKAFLRDIDAELMPLVCYNTEWLESGDPDDPVADKDEWVEFAAGVTAVWNERWAGPPDVKYVEVWNEPNMPMFYGGTRESYFEIFRKTAERYDRDFPEVQTGGPALTPAPWADPEGWYADFIESVGEHADFVTHHIYHDSTRDAASVAAEVVAKTEAFRALPGKERGKLALTETDGWFDGPAKTRYLLDRNFAFLAIQDYLLASMHFTTLAYNESGGYIFGVMTEPGAPLADRYWPFWIVRNLAGDLVHALSDTEAIRVAATSHTNDAGQTLYAAVLWNGGEQPQAVRLDHVVHQEATDLPVRIDRLRGQHIQTRMLEAASSLPDAMTLEANEAVAITLAAPGRRHWAFHDLNDQEAPALLASSDQPGIAIGQTINLNVAITNTTGVALAGTVNLAEVPRGWSFVVSGEPELSLGPFETAEVSIALTAGSTPPEVNRMAFGAHGELRHLNHAVPIVAALRKANGNTIAESLPIDLVFLSEPTDDSTKPSIGEHPQP